MRVIPQPAPAATSQSQTTCPICDVRAECESPDAKVRKRLAYTQQAPRDGPEKEEARDVTRKRRETGGVWRPRESSCLGRLLLTATAAGPRGELRLRGWLIRMASVVLSEAEKVYIVHGVQEDLRVDGRGCEDYRCTEVETDVVSNTSGSARVKLGQTDILVGVKAEMGTPKLDKPKEGYLEFFVDCSANAAPEFEGRGGEELGTEIANTLYRIFNNESSLDLKLLCINPREHCWVLYVDVLLLECGGNLFDAISVAVKAALFNTRIPKVRVVEDEGGREIELSDDPFDCIRLNVDNVPCIVTLSKIGYRHVVDATLQEEACSLASLLISVTSRGSLTCMKKVGRGSLDPESIFEMMETGKRVGKLMHTSLQTILEKEESLGTTRKKVGFLG